MAAQAAKTALVRAGLRADQLDCVISACSVMEQAIPCMAVLVHRRLGLGESGILAFDVNATCLSFVTALDLAAASIAIGRYRRVLIVSSGASTPLDIVRANLERFRTGDGNMPADQARDLDIML